MCELGEAYESRFKAILEPLSQRLQDYIERVVVAGYPRIDRVSARAKKIDSFLRKAARVEKDGTAKYADPLSEIQDQIGARITTYYLRDVEPVERVVESYFGPIEKCRKEPESPSEFGYEGSHYILFLPPDVFTRELLVPEAPKYFELQIKTLFQHAWSESAHDLLYKPGVTLTRDQRRRGAFTGAQAWGADRIFDELAGELSP